MRWLMMVKLASEQNRSKASGVRLHLEMWIVTFRIGFDSTAFKKARMVSRSILKPRRWYTFGAARFGMADGVE